MRIIPVDQRLAEKSGAKILIVGPSVVGKTSLLKTLPPDVEGPPILPPQDGFLLVDRAKFPAYFAGDVEPELARFMADSQVPWNVAAAGGPNTNPAWANKPSWYLLTTEDRMIPPVAQHSMSKRAGSTVVDESKSQ